MPHHQEQDYQSLMLHAEAIRRMQGTPAPIDRAPSILDRWNGMETTPNPIFKEWKRILRERDWDALRCLPVNMAIRFASHRRHLARCRMRCA